MKTELRLADHAVLHGQKIIEVWYDGEFIAEVTGADGAGVRVISKHPLDIWPSGDGMLNVVEVGIKPMGEPVPRLI